MTKNLINFFIYIFFLTFLIIDTKLPYNIFGLKIFVVDFIFLLLIVLIFLNKKIINKRDHLDLENNSNF